MHLQGSIFLTFTDFIPVCVLLIWYWLHHSWSLFYAYYHPVFPRSSLLYRFSSMAKECLTFINSLDSLKNSFPLIGKSHPWRHSSFTQLFETKSGDECGPHYVSMGCSPECVLWCRMRDELLLNVFPHWGQWLGPSLLWSLWCTARWEFCLKDFPHSGHWYGASFVWILWCLVRQELSLKALPHWLHS